MKTKLLMVVILIGSYLLVHATFFSSFYDLESNYAKESGVAQKKVKEPQSLNLQQSKILVLGSTSFVIVSGLLAFFIYKQKRIKEIQEKADLQQKVLRLQMNPHFIFNSLASIQNLMINNNIDAANKYLSKFSTLVRSVLYNSFHDKITIEKEMKTLDSYLALQKLRYINRFDYSISIDPAVDAEYTEIPVMLIQPFVENAVEHGIKPKSAAGHINLICERKNHSVLIKIIDNGIGREKSEMLRLKFQKDHKPLATDVTIERIKMLNKRHKQKIKLNIIDLKDEHCEACGTKVIFELPV